MQTRSLEAIVNALNSANVRYLIAGGLAVVAHGYVRFTADLDLILDLEADNTRRAMTALATLKYVPRAPVLLEAFADAAQRARWVEEKGLTVFSLWSTDHSATEVDLFVEPPLDFANAYAAATVLEIAPGVVAHFVALDDLLHLKATAARPVDLNDIEQLKRVRRGPTNE